jgi:hypothetical protein
MTHRHQIELQAHRQHSRGGGNGGVKRKIGQAKAPSSTHVVGQATNASPHLALMFAPPSARWLSLSRFCALQALQFAMLFSVLPPALRVDGW